jgi:hypothetical protein
VRRTLTALIVTALASGAFLLVATLTLDAWHWRLYDQAQAFQSEGSKLNSIRVENPYEPLGHSVITYMSIFIACCAAATFWAVFLVLPSLMAARRVFASALVSHMVAAAVVCTLSGIAFAFIQDLTPYISPMITFTVGGAIGLLSLVLLAKMLPANTSLERSRDG